MTDAGGVQPGTVLGQAAKPAFAVLPQPDALFLNRARRFARLAPGHQLEPYLTFLAVLTGAQHEAQASSPTPVPPSEGRIAQALEHGMPPLLRTLYEPDEAMLSTLADLLTRLATAELSGPSAEAVSALLAAPPDERRQAVLAALKDASGGEEHDLARRVLVLAGLQVHFAKLASRLQASELKPVANGVCPVCGSAPATSAVVGWPTAHNTRYCTCSLCGTMWNVVRVSCLLCGSTDGISFRGIEGQPDTIKGETCEKCRGYVKILYQVKDPALEAVADDVATLGLDMLLAQDGWRRGGHNPFLLGY